MKKFVKWDSKNVQGVIETLKDLGVSSRVLSMMLRMNSPLVDGDIILPLSSEKVGIYDLNTLKSKGLSLDSEWEEVLPKKLEKHIFYPKTFAEVRKYMDSKGSIDYSESLKHLSALLHARDAYRELEPDNKEENAGYSIRVNGLGELEVKRVYHDHIFSFQNKSTAEKFLHNFEDSILSLYDELGHM